MNICTNMYEFPGWLHDQAKNTENNCGQKKKTYTCLESEVYIYVGQEL